MFYIKMSYFIIFLTNFELVISWYFMSQLFETVKELHKVLFSISVNITNLHLLFVGQQLRKTRANVYQQSKLNYTHQLYFQKNIQSVITLSTSQHKDRRPIKFFSVFLIFLGKPNKSVYPIALKKYKPFLGVD